MDARTLSHRTFDLGAAGELTTQALIHEYPGKRALFRARLDGRDVVAKFYLLPLRTAWEWWRGARGARALQAVGVPSPAVRFAGFERTSRCWLTVVDWIEADIPWPPPRNPLPHATHELLLRTLAAHHEAGVVQSDLNWANFIPRDGVLHSIDGDRVRRTRAPLPWRRARGNLLRLYGSKTHFDEDEIHWGWTRYCTLRGLTISDDDAWAFVTAVQFRRRQVAESVAYRKLQGWKHFVRERRNGHLVVADGQRLGDAARARAAELPVTAGGKGEAEARRVEADTMGDRPVVIQGHSASATPGPAAWRSPPTPTRAWIRAATAARLRLPVERPVGLVEMRAWLLGRRGHLISAQRAHASLRQALESGEADVEQTLDLLQSLVRRLETARMNHHSLTLDRLGWDGSAVVLLDAGGLQLLPRWRYWLGQTTRVDISALATELAALTGLPERGVATRLRPPRSRP
ncbi:hypothetical protein [Aquisalimonas asiatica]|uniref:Lipopolysaccharide kinase (Kdo/WaaP) family protein n=1 Tax=Aquisalimonas asiatica TaxID=406100 RepID=A0A1H8VHU5_9GAMM|nr:hypothetical protein [Aquisalimonas asiatica]SEP14873.1 hypothetical protein SAMN04488052_11284 [Aquisalimonas asiatica]